MKFSRCLIYLSKKVEFTVLFIGNYKGEFKACGVTNQIGTCFRGWGRDLYGLFTRGDLHLSEIL